MEVPLLRSTFWTDSRITLAYIQNDAKRFKTFVANRVSLIRQHNDPAQWRHVKGKENSADVLLRGCSAESVPQSWFCGPSFLGEYKSTWPSDGRTSVDLMETDAEVKRDVSVAVASTANAVRHPMEALIEHYYSFYKLKKALSWLMRVRVSAELGDKSKLAGHTTASELARADEQVVRYAQGQTCKSEIAALMERGAVATSSPVKNLNPILNSRGILVVGGRLKHARMGYEAKHPVILSSAHKVSKMIAKECHDAAHLGTEWSLSRLRHKYWIVRARSLLKEVKHACVVCKKLYAPTHHQKMADLPPERGESGSPGFSCVGVDIFGPFYVKLGRLEVKRYGCLYTRLTVRAVHIEVLNSLETDAFLAVFFRFIARRGCPVKVFSDNGSAQ
ncbi:PREDICTED: uncharacterized protein LOC106819449 [Priapulus caudatus]|uniref:Uncharacterized protein LOC106819449 n=1 Tax=Priapulus caudatus TaxID=37621 RepID=A0ABM1F546_PRICU|nr:PREDICTED: uncharacterized protein LOC106819449 [Priapulus caudatus]